MCMCDTQLDRDGLHDLNVQADWHNKGGTYWVRYIHVELLSCSASSAGSMREFISDS